MKLKIFLIVILVMTVICTVFAGCSNIRKDIKIIVKAPTLTMEASFIDSECDSAYAFLEKVGADFAMQYENANITVAVEQYDNTDEAAAISNAYGSNDAPDVLYNDYFTMEAHIHDGHVVPVDDIISEDTRADIDQGFWKQSMINGKTYMMPFLYRQNVLVYNKDIFRAAGLEQYISEKDEIQSWSFDEWEHILAALRAYMPDTSYPIMMYAANNQGDTHIMTYCRIMGSSFFDSDMKFNLETEKGIAGLRWIKECADKGYMPKDAEKMNILDNYDMFMSGQLAIYVCNAGNVPNFNCDFGLVNFPSVNGGCNTNFLTGFEVFDNGSPDRLAIAKAFVRYIYESDYIDYSASNIPCSSSVSDKYREALEPMQKYINNSDKSVNFTGGNPNWLGVRDVFYKHIAELLTGRKSPEEAAKVIDRDCNAAIEEGLRKSNLHE